jgi:phosphoribosylformimino-5-aminoimidazole carboxamide ribotide isomerase
VVDLDGAKEGRPVNLAIVERIVRATKLRVEVGGGIRTEEAMEYVLAIGAHRLILGTRALADMAWFEAMTLDARFRNRLVLGLDAKDGLVRTHGWTQPAEESPRAVDIAQDVDGLPLAAIIYTDIARDGLLKGLNLDATIALADAISIPVVASGGLASIDDVHALLQPRARKLQGAIAGRALYDGRLDAATALALIARAP